MRKGFRPGDRQLFGILRERPQARRPAWLAISRERGIRTLTLVGLATDYCVAYSALDAVRLGFDTTVQLGACRGIDLAGSVARMNAKMREAGVTLV